MHATLNLLSPEKKASLRTEFVFAFLQSALGMLLLCVGFSSATVLGLRMVVGGMHDDLVQRAAASTDDSKGVTAEIAEINRYLARAEELTAAPTSWSRILARIATITPRGVVLSSINMTEGGKFMLSGQAETREDVLALRAALESSEEFAEVSSPLSNILQPRDVSFTFEFKTTAKAAKDAAARVPAPARR